MAKNKKGRKGLGNYWILDIAEGGTLGKVFFACHDPAVLVIHSQNLNEYLHHLLAFYENPSNCHWNDVYEKTVTTIWEDNKHCIPKAEFLKDNPKYQVFLKKFTGENWTLADLRTGQNKQGFAWGKFGANQFTERHPSELLWVLKNKRKGWLTRLLGE